MLGTTPLVSMSERRLSAITKSALLCLAARRALAASTSRIVSPSCSRTVRSCCPGVSTRTSKTGQRSAYLPISAIRKGTAYSFGFALKFSIHSGYFSDLFRLPPASTLFTESHSTEGHNDQAEDRNFLR